MYEKKCVIICSLIKDSGLFAPLKKQGIFHSFKLTWQLVSIENAFRTEDDVIDGDISLEGDTHLGLYDDLEVFIAC